MLRRVLSGFGLGLLLVGVAIPALAAPRAKGEGRPGRATPTLSSQRADKASAGPKRRASDGKPAAKTGKERPLFKAWEGGPHLFTLDDPHPVRVLFFHGSQQPTHVGDGSRPPNELIGRVASALRQSGLRHEILSMPWETNPGAVIDWLHQEQGPFILSGHSAGGAFGEWLTRMMPEKFVASFLLNPAGSVRPQKVLTLLVRGSRDMIRRDARSEGVQKIVARGGDHSLRYRPDPSMDKAAATLSPETGAMNLTVAKAIKSFLAQQLKDAS